MMNTYLSDKFKIVSFFSIVAVIYAHTFYWENQPFAINSFIQSFIGLGIVKRIAIPLFFAISGYLFFLKTDKGLVSVIKKMKSRVRSLLLPYILWNIWFELVYVLLYFTPQISSFVNSDIVEKIINQNVWTTLVMVFWEPGGFHLWFIKYLFLVILCTPILYYSLKKIPELTVILTSSICLITNNIDGFWLALMWFSIGGYLAIKKRNLLFVPLPIVKYGCILALLIDATCIGAQLYINPVIQFLFMILGVGGAWWGVDCMIKTSLTNMEWLNKLCGYTFFIYLFHEPTLNVLKKLPPVFLGQSQWVYLGCYLVVPWVMILLAVGVGALIKRVAPTTYGILVGGRL